MDLARVNEPINLRTLNTYLVASNKTTKKGKSYIFFFITLELIHNMIVWILRFWIASLLFVYLSAHLVVAQYIGGLVECIV